MPVTYLYVTKQLQDNIDNFGGFIWIFIVSAIMFLWIIKHDDT